MAYRTIESTPFITLGKLIEQLREIQERSSTGTIYVLDAQDEYLTHVEVVEITLSDGSKAQDVRLVRKTS